MLHYDDSCFTVYADRAAVFEGRHALDAGNGASGEKLDDRVPIVRRTVSQEERVTACLADIRRFRTGFAQSAGGTGVQPLERRVESADAAEAGRHCNLCHRQIRFVDQLLRKVHSTRLSDGDWSRSQILKKQSTQVAR